MSSLVAASIFILYKVASQMFLNVNLILIFLFSLFIYAWRAVKNLLLQTVLKVSCFPFSKEWDK
jgi:Na+/H+ antiporter NhaB